MAYLYSKSTNSFYREDVHGTGVPADVVEITDGEHEQLIRGQYSKMLTSNEAGWPILVDRPATIEEQTGMTLEQIYAQAHSFNPYTAGTAPWEQPPPPPAPKRVK